MDQPLISSYTMPERTRLWRDVDETAWQDWRWQMRNRITTVEDARHFLRLSPEEESAWQSMPQNFTALTPYYATLLSDAHDDPLRRQHVPLPQENDAMAHADDDPLEEEIHMPVPGLIHRYPDRVVALTGCVCAAYCRHCNRRRAWQQRPRFYPWQWYQRMAAYVRATPTIHDVILSGGDPLLMSDQRLCATLDLFHAIPHVDTVRIGSRVPVVLPMRITAALTERLSAYERLWLLTHFNHAREVTYDSASACARISAAGIPVQNQSVLLRGINDTVDAQYALCRALQQIRVRPYYLFSCDRVAGSAHFWSEPSEGAHLVAALHGRIGGLFIPRFAIDSAQGKHITG